MKKSLKILLCSGALALGTFTASAEFRLGGYIGASMSWIPQAICWYDVHGANPHGSIYGGIMGELDFDNIKGQIAVQYAGMGYSDHWGQQLYGISYSYQYDLNISYIGIPLFIGYHFGTGSTIYIGPQFDFYVGNSSRERIAVNNVNNDTKTNFDDKYFAPFLVGIDVKYEYMFTDNIGIHVLFYGCPMHTFTQEGKIGNTTITRLGNNIALQIGLDFKFEL